MEKEQPLDFIIGGKHKSSTEILSVYNPYDDSLFSSVCLAQEEDVKAAVKCAKEAFDITREIPAYKRKAILESLASLINEHSREFEEILIKESGKVRKHAKLELQRANDTIKNSAEEAIRIDGTILELDKSELGDGKIGFLKRFPLGVILAITPFNYPLNIACHKIGPAIASGNSFILKPSSKTPVSSLLLGELIIEAGYPPEAVNVIPCNTKLAEDMVKDERISFLSFTGSAEVGWHLKSIAGRKKVGLELGGNAAVIVHSDANLEFATDRIAFGSCVNSGQVCISVQRVLVHKAVYDEFLQKISSKFNSLKCGNPNDPDVDIGPMISKTSLNEVLRKINAALENSAAIHHGGGQEGNIISPTIILNSNKEMEVNSSELFAPVITIQEYTDFEEAIKTANDSEYGLQMGLFTNDITRIMHAYKIAEVGGIVVNDIPTCRLDYMPYGGVKSSGIGKEGPKYTIEEMTELKLMILNQIKN